MKKKDYLVIGIGLFCMLLTILIGSSYAYWKLSKVQEDRNIIATGCFNITFTGGSGINLQNAYPISDAKGLELTPYTFKIENMCDSYAAYQINLETLKQSTGVKVLNDQYIRVDLQEGITSRINSTLNSTIETNTTLSNSNSAYKLYSNYLKPRETKTYNLRAWMDKDTPAIDEVMDALFSAKVTIDFSYMENPFKDSGTLKLPNYSYITINGEQYIESTGGEFWDYKNDITKIVFQNDLTPMEAVYSWDVSEDNSKSVMSYLVKSEEDNTKYTLYLQGDGGVKANSDCTSLFDAFENLEEIENLIYFDTSNVTSMFGMFQNCRNLKSLDVSSFDTSKVTSMLGMFSGCSRLTSLDLSNFDTRNVTSMQFMFGADGLSNIPMSIEQIKFGLNFNTSNVTNMMAMFQNSPNLVNVDLSNFDFTNVENITSMFAFCHKLNIIINIRNTKINTYTDAFGKTAIDSNAKVVINYTEESSNLVDRIIATKTSDSNVIKGNLIN